MTVIAPPALVPGIARTPLPFGLFSVLTFRPPTVDRWETGVQWEVGTCLPALGLPAFDCDAEASQKDLSQQERAIGEASPFTVYGYYACSALSESLTRMQELSDEHLLTREEARVEQALWTGDLGNSPVLAGAGTDDLTPADGAVSPAVGLGLLEAYIASEYGSQGVIHVSRALATVLVKDAGVSVSGGTLRTPLGTPVVAGAGYPGTGPSDEVGPWWAYVTPALMGYRSEIFAASDGLAALLDIRTNDAVAISERNYLLGFDPCGVAAVNIDPDL